MTSLHHDDSIEIITSSNSAAYVHRPTQPLTSGFISATATSGSHVACSRPANVIDIGLTLVSAATGAVHPVGFGGPSAPIDGSSTRFFRRKMMTSLSAKESAKEKRIKKAVMCIATLMILASMVLVGASLSMSEHIDEMGKRSGFTSDS